MRYDISDATNAQTQVQGELLVVWSDNSTIYTDMEPMQPIGIVGDTILRSQYEV